MDRRVLLKSLALAPLARLASACGDGTVPTDDAAASMDAGVADPPAATLLLGPYLCDPRPDAMGFWLEGAGAAEYTVLVTPASGGAALPALAFVLDAYRIGRADVGGLAPETTYLYELVSAGVVVAGGAFRTPPASRASAVRLAIGADIHFEWKPYVAFDRIRELAPDALFMVGDQVYSDYRIPGGTVAATESAYRGLYPFHWGDAALTDCWANVPTLLMWDDHEILNDYDGTTDAARFAAADAAYRAYQGVRNPAPYRDGVHYFAVSIGPVDAFVLDTRSYREGNDLADGPDKSMLGAEQRADLEAFLLASDASVKLVVSPTPFHVHATTGTDGWAKGFAAERDALFAFIADNAITGVVLASGDQHWPAVVQHDLGAAGSLIELQCTPTAAHARMAPAIAGSPGVLYVGPGDVGFGLLDVDATVSPPVVQFAWVGGDGVERYTLAIDVP